MSLYIVAEYCSHDFYHGWWLYERDNNRGRLNANNEWGWMRDASSWSSRKQAWDMFVRAGHDPPSVAQCCQEFATWVANRFPDGVCVRHDRDTYYLLEVLASRPRQRPGVIRTSKGAAMADARGHGGAR